MQERGVQPLGSPIPGWGQRHEAPYATSQGEVLMGPHRWFRILHECPT